MPYLTTKEKYHILNNKDMLAEFLDIEVSDVHLLPDNIALNEIEKSSLRMDAKVINSFIKEIKLQDLIVVDEECEYCGSKLYFNKGKNNSSCECIKCHSIFIVNILDNKLVPV